MQYTALQQWLMRLLIFHALVAVSTWLYLTNSLVSRRDVPDGFVTKDTREADRTAKSRQHLSCSTPMCTAVHPCHAAA